MDTIRILVLEDDAELREMLSDSLRDEGYQVADVGSGAEAVRCAAEGPFDLIVVDVKMEGIDGLETLARLKEVSPGLHSLVVTGYATEADSIRAIRLGVEEYLRKPFRLDEFLDAVSRLVARVQKEREEATRQGALERTVLWALEAVGRSVDLAGGDGRSLVALGRRAYRAGLALGLSEQAAREAQMALLTLAIRERSPELETDFLFQGLPESARWLTGNLEADSTQARLVGAVLALAEADQSDDLPAAEWLAARHPGRFSPEVLAAVEGGEELPERPRHRSGLLAVAQVLVGAADLEGAGKAFDSLLAQADPPAEAAGALVELGRLAITRGERERGKSYTESAVRLSQRLSSGRAALVKLEAGLLLFSQSDPQGAELVRTALPVLEEMGMRAAAARGRIALAWLREASPEEATEALRTLLTPRYLPDLVRSADWLIPLLLEQANPKPEVQRAVQRLVRDAPAQLRENLRKGALTSRGRLAALAAIEATGRQGHEDTLRLLSAEEDPEVARRAAEVLRDERPEGESLAPVLRIYSFAMFEVFLGDHRVPDDVWGTQKVRYLLALLASRKGQPVNQDLLLEEFWPESPTRAKRYLYQATSALRKALSPPDWEGDLQYVVRSRRGLHLSNELPRWHDLEELEAGIDKAREHQEQGDLNRAADALRAAVELYRGPYLEGCYMEWAVTARNTLERTALEAMSRLLELTDQLGRHRETLEVANRILEVDPYRQEAHLAIMEASTNLGRPEDALRQFERCEKLLKRELDLEPTIEMIRAREKAKLAM